MAQRIGMHGAGAGTEAIAINLSVNTTLKRATRTAGIIGTVGSALFKEGHGRVKEAIQGWAASSDTLSGVQEAAIKAWHLAPAATWRDAVAAVCVGLAVTYGSRAVYKVGMFRNSLTGKVSNLLASGQSEEVEGGGRRFFGILPAKRPAVTAPAAKPAAPAPTEAA